MLKKAVYILGLLVSGLILGLVYTISQMIYRPLLAPPIALSDKEYKEFSATSEDGIDLVGYFYQGAPEAGLVLLCHGHGVDHGRMNDMVGFLRTAGYSLLLFDFRAHGRSGGKLCTIGQNEWKDVKAILAQARQLGYLRDDMPIAAYGRSMGAATLINGSAELPEIKAFILESSFESLRLIAARDARHNLWLPDTFITDIGFWLTDLFTGADYSNNKPMNKTIGISNRAVFLIHDEKDHRANLEAFNALKSRLPQAITWSVPDAYHVCAHQVAPVEFENRFLNFLYSSGVHGRR